MRSDTWARKIDAFLSLNPFDPTRVRLCRTFLVGFDHLLLNAPNWFTNAFVGVTEETLRVQSQLQSSIAVKGPTTFGMSWDGDDEAIAGRLGGIIRAADELLAATVRPGLPRSTEAWRVGDHYVIPRNSRRRKPTLNQDYPRRGLLRHSILPTEVAGLEVRLHLLSISAPISGPPAKFGAAIFPELELLDDLDFKEAGIVAKSVNSPDQFRVLDTQLAASAKLCLLGAVWPELTMPPEQQKHLVAQLRRAALLEDGQAYPQIVVPGSWHEAQGKSFENVSRVVDGDGEELFAYRKRIRYISKKGRKELIHPGDQLPVVVTEDFLIGFAICRDFCHMGSDSPYMELNVDFVLVPSMGEESTMASHKTVAKGIRSKWNARAFVVQQVAPPRAATPAMVLSPSDDPLAGGLVVDVTEPFTTYDGHL